MIAFARVSIYGWEPGLRKKGKETEGRRREVERQKVGGEAETEGGGEGEETEGGGEAETEGGGEAETEGGGEAETEGGGEAETEGRRSEVERQKGVGRGKRQKGRGR